jgi:MFS family permease
VVLSPYRDVLRAPGALAFSAAGFVARMPISMVGLGIVVLISARTGSYGLAGALSATFALVNAGGAPALARLIDRYGQRRVSLPAISLHVMGMVTFLVLVSSDAPRWSFFLAVTVAAVASPSIGSMVRARWTYVLGTGPRMHTAFSLESVIDEVVFVTGPPLVTVLATQVWPSAGLVAALVLLVAGGAWLFAQRVTEPPPQPGEHGGAWVIRLKGMPVIVVVMLWLGTIFGAMEVTAVAFADERGHRAAAGLVLALYAFGSMTGGLFYGLVHWRTPLPTRFLLGAVGMALTLVPLPFVTSLLALYPLALIAGFSIAPTMVAGIGVIERIVSAGRFNEGMAWAFSGLAVGLAVGASVAGAVADRIDSRWGFLVSTVAGVLAVAACVGGLRSLRLATAGLPQGA